MFEELSFDGICDYKKVEDVLKNADGAYSGLWGSKKENDEL